MNIIVQARLGDDSMFGSIVPWFVLGVGYGKCRERRRIRCIRDRYDPCCRRRR
ncbi:MAG: hypothetical protein GX339_01475 [Tissierellia bacterium]|nr:hypothetical protein [Tissierellia bacterium]